MKSGLTTVFDKTAKVLEGIERLAGTRVLVGVPAEKAARRSGPINNAALAYIHDKGAPEVNIPARPFMEPGIKNAAVPINGGLRAAGEAALEGRPEAMQRNFMRVGAAARDAIKAKISSNIPPPLQPATIAARARRSPGSKYRRKAQTAADVTALVDTGQLRNAINFVIRKVK